MSPSRTKEELVITPIKHSPEQKCSMGAIITGLDLNDITDEELEQLRAATHKYQVVVIKNQHNLDPVKHWDLVTRLDPKAPNVHGHGTVKQFQKTGGLLSVRDSEYLSPAHAKYSRNGTSMAFPLLLMFVLLAKVIKATTISASRTSQHMGQAIIIMQHHPARRLSQPEIRNFNAGTWMPLFMSENHLILLLSAVSKHL